MPCCDDDGKRLPTTELQGFPVRLFDPFLACRVPRDEIYTSMCFVIDFMAVESAFSCAESTLLARVAHLTVTRRADHPIQRANSPVLLPPHTPFLYWRVR